MKFKVALKIKQRTCKKLRFKISRNSKQKNHVNQTCAIQENSRSSSNHKRKENFT
jgi:hypothetical protein